jgi:hypothetical protein
VRVTYTYVCVDRLAERQNTDSLFVRQEGSVNLGSKGCETRETRIKSGKGKARGEISALWSAQDGGEGGGGGGGEGGGAREIAKGELKR